MKIKPSITAAHYVLSLIELAEISPCILFVNTNSHRLWALDNISANSGYFCQILNKK